MKKYYIEMTIKESCDNYHIQSKWFSKKETAKKWLAKNFDVIDFAELKVCIMSAKWEDGIYKDIIFEECISAVEFYALKKTYKV